MESRMQKYLPQHRRRIYLHEVYLREPCESDTYHAKVKNRKLNSPESRKSEHLIIGCRIRWLIKRVQSDSAN